MIGGFAIWEFERGVRGWRCGTLGGNGFEHLGDDVDGTKGTLS